MFPPVLRREILILLCLKAALLVALYLLFFSPSHQTTVTSSALRMRITDSQQP